ncbi:MAG: class I SAM-dependent methyltransferase [Deltaproteobacteria bacterium]|nr:class I SAM-dependent methyltransferase [Deltaproteobacteria bacterium]
MKQDQGPYLARFYEQHGIWGEDPAADERTPLAASLVPDDAQSILDVGCGEGSFLRMAANGRLAVGVDASSASMAACGGLLRARASAAALPFGPGSFDLVAANEVLEHLPGPVFAGALSEAARVARRYILVSVPWQEQLSRRMARCAGCGNVFHVWGHLRSFGPGDLESLFPGFALKERAFAGPVEKDFPRAALWLRRRAGRYEYEPLAMCPACGQRAEKPRRLTVSVATSLAAKLLGPRHRKWAVCLYERCASST